MTQAVVTNKQSRESKESSVPYFLRRIFSFYIGNTAAILGTFIVGTFIIVSLAAPIMANFDPDRS